MEDKNALAGYIMLMNGEYDKAQDLFIKSFSPLEALHVSCSLKHISALYLNYLFPVLESCFCYVDENGFKALGSSSSACKNFGTRRAVPD